MSITGESTTKELTIVPADDSGWRHAQREFLAAATTCNGLAQPLLAVLGRIDPVDLAPLPGHGRTLERLQLLASVAAADVTAARVLEPHLDAVAILSESRHLTEFGCAGQTWGVFASEGPSSTLVAREEGGKWSLSGVKPWCSLGDRLTHALVTARTSEGEPGFFMVDLRQRTVRSGDVTWVARGLANVESGPLIMEKAVATAVGESGWYLSRPGFRWGGISVAACWWGGCVPLFAEILYKSKRGEPNPLVSARVGRLYRALESARLHLERSAAYIDQPLATLEAERAAVVAHAARGVVADALDETLAATRDILGPAALVLNETIARRFADLEIYASQYHRGPDDASLSAHLGSEGAWW